MQRKGPMLQIENEFVTEFVMHKCIFSSKNGLFPCIKTVYYKITKLQKKIVGPKLFTCPLFPCHEIF